MLVNKKCDSLIDMFIFNLIVCVTLWTVKSGVSVQDGSSKSYPHISWYDINLVFMYGFARTIHQSVHILGSRETNSDGKNLSSS